MINKQNLWFLTLFSLILVLSVYYITMPNDLLIASNYTTNEKTETKEETKDQETVSEADNLTALRVSLDEERDKEKEELRNLRIDAKEILIGAYKQLLLYENVNILKKYSVFFVKT